MVEEEDEINDAEEEEEAQMEEDSALVDQGDKQMLVPKEEGNSNGNSGTLVRNPPMLVRI